MTIVSSSVHAGLEALNVEYVLSTWSLEQLSTNVFAEG